MHLASHLAKVFVCCFFFVFFLFFFFFSEKKNIYNDAPQSSYSRQMTKMKNQAVHC